MGKLAAALTERAASLAEDVIAEGELIAVTAFSGLVSHIQHRGIICLKVSLRHSFRIYSGSSD